MTSVGGGGYASADREPLLGKTVNLADALTASAARAPDRTALYLDGAATTYGELDGAASRFASCMADLGVEPGDRLALWLPNHPSFAVALYGAWRAGGIVVPLNPMLTWHEARYILEDSGARVLVRAMRNETIEGPGLEELHHQIVVGAPPGGAELAFESLVSGTVSASSGVEVDSDNLAMLGYTSGTTGLPKGAMLTHGNLATNVDQMLTMPVAPGPEDVALGILPLSHIYGLNVLLNLSVRVGATIVLQERFDPAASLRAIREHAVTRVASAPPAYVAWLGSADATREDFATVTVATSGAAPLTAEVHRSFQERFGLTIWEGYGLTETSPTVTSTSVGGVAKPGSVGRPLERIELRLIDRDGEEAEPGDPGEVVVRGPNVFRGYWQHPDDTARVLKGGWFRTGDIGVLDEDGDLYLVDRQKDLILVSGFNVYPKEVEDALVAHGKVRDAAAVGAPDALRGEQVRALVVLEPGSQASQDELRSWCRTRLASFKIPGIIEFVPEIPRNAAGKVLRRELR